MKKRTRIHYYREDANGDYLCVFPDLWFPHADTVHRMVESRGAAIAGNVSSVCATSTYDEYLEDACTRVKKSDVPKEWLKAFGV